MEQLTNTPFWLEMIRSERLNTLTGGEIVSAFEDGVEDVDTDVLAAVSNRLLHLALPYMWSALGKGIDDACLYDFLTPAALRRRRGTADVGTLDPSNIIVEALLLLFTLVRNPGHEWFSELVRDFEAVIRKLVGKAKRDVMKNNGYHKVTEDVIDGDGTRRKRVVRQTEVATEDEELQRRSDARQSDEHGEGGVESRLLMTQTARELARSPLDVEATLMLCEGFLLAEIALEQNRDVRTVRGGLRAFAAKTNGEEAKGVGSRRSSPDEAAE